jgi:Tfp pilus assembly protein PilN
MIEINLLPEDLKLALSRRKTSLGIEVRYFLYLIPLTAGLLICLHVYLTALIIAKNSQLAVLNRKWQELEPQRKNFDDFSKENTVFSQDAKALQQLMEQRINWSEKLNKLSLNLPSGVWFNEIAISQKGFILQGSVVSLQKEEMMLIKQLIDNLKNDPGFHRDFSSLVFSSTQKKTIGGYDIVDFVLEGALKPK